MKRLFVCRVNYLVEFDKIEMILALHREYLKKGYDSGFLLASGPRNPRDGGLIIGQFQNKDEVLEFAKQDPFCLEGYAEYEIIEFEPVLHAQCLNEFLKD